LQIEDCKFPNMTPQELSERLWHFAARIGKVVDALPDTRLGRHVAGQLLRCGTSAPRLQFLARAHSVHRALSTICNFQFSIFNFQSEPTPGSAALVVPSPYA
jgi:hypothetical protein